MRLNIDLTPPEHSGNAAQRLREEFDASFAKPPADAPPALETILAIQIDGKRFALRTAELSGILADRKIVFMPSSRPGYQGLAGIRGRLVPVFSLGSLLGVGAPDASARWLALCGGLTLALSFSEMDGFHPVATSAITAVRHDEQSAVVSNVVRLGTESRPLLHLTPILQSLTNRALIPSPEKGSLP